MSTHDTQPLHIAIIPDGNRRWARKNALEVWKGHEQGARRIRDLAHAAFAHGATHLSLWGSSLDNLTKRPEAERAALLEVYTHAVKDMLKPEEHEKMAAHVRFIGRWRDIFPQELQTLIEELDAQTAHYTGRTLVVLLAYNGDDEMVDAVQRIASAADIAPEDITPQTIKDHLWTCDLPPVDLCIRTGGEPHLSAGFMMWDMANVHLHFTDTLFPDFTPDDLRAAIDGFGKRARRLGA